MNPLIFDNDVTFVKVQHSHLVIKTKSIFEPKAPEQAFTFKPQSIGYDCFVFTEYFGNISFEAMRFLDNSNVTVLWLDHHGVTFSLMPRQPNNTLLRLAQYRTFENSEKKNEIAKAIIKKKISSQLELISNIFPEIDIPDFEQVNDDTLKNGLLEGNVAKFYFANYGKIFPKSFEFTGRGNVLNNRENYNARDKANACFNLSYGILAAVMRKVLIGAGLDIGIGFIHKTRENFDALTWDMLEIFRTQVDEVIYELISSNKLTGRDFFVTDKYVTYLKGKGKKELITRLCKRLDTFEMLQEVRKLNRFMLGQTKELSFD